MKTLATFNKKDDAKVWIGNFLDNKTGNDFGVVKVITHRTIEDAEGHTLEKTEAEKWLVVLNPPRYIEQTVLIGGDGDGFDDDTEL